MFEREKKLDGKKIAILATDGFEFSELKEPRQALVQAGAKTEIVSLISGTIKSWKEHNWGPAIPVDRAIAETSSQDYDGLLLPGGVINADKLRGDREAILFVKEFCDQEKPIAAICHAAWILIETGYVRGRTMTSWPTLRTDLENAGAHWVNLEVVNDSGWVTSRKPSDIPAFNKKMIEEFQEGPHPNPFLNRIKSAANGQFKTPVSKN